ncbi:ECF transporter S component [Microbacterium binotii]|uniref:ECF transporter S component n=1 Tax=Microbacterium binotii TaxID=462710 RepID=UPI001F35A7F7|nr:ECF transporter S component [Microbacterium binotii]UIN30847.1 ECF transporter S component [Microbacterium binotii]
MRLLQRPGVGLLVGLISGVVVLPYIGTNLWWAFFAELPFLLVLYRSWSTWLHVAGALIIGVSIRCSQPSTSTCGPCRCPR